MIALVLAVLAGAPSPQAAALAFLHPAVTHSHPTAKVVARTANYAIVRFTGGIIESQLSKGYVLAKKFSFGWQAIDLAAFGKPLQVCALHSHGISGGDITALRPFLDSSTADCSVTGHQRDIGDAVDVEAVRKLMPSTDEIVPYVRVAGGYAMGEWWGNGGGQNFFKKTSSGWKQFAGGGGAYQPGELHEHYGVPLTIANALLRP